jgi:hypothetical protein
MRSNVEGFFKYWREKMVVPHHKLNAEDKES